jgi:hypothetical protein
MTEIFVVSRKWDGSFHRRTRAVEVGADGAGRGYGFRMEASSMFQTDPSKPPGGFGY